MLEFQFAPTTLITVGIRALSYPFAILGGACFGSLAISYSRGHVRELFVINAAIMCAFGGALAATSPNTPGLALAMETLDSFGIGAIIVPSLTLALYACPDEYIGTTTALSLTSRFLGGSVGVGIYYNVFKSKLTAHAPEIAVAAVKAGLPAAEAASFVEAFLVSPIAAEQIKGVTATVLGAATAAQAEVYAEALKWVWITTIPFSAVAVLCCLALPNIKRFMSGRIAVVSISIFRRVLDDSNANNHAGHSLRYGFGQEGWNWGDCCCCEVGSGNTCGTQCRVCRSNCPWLLILPPTS